MNARYLGFPPSCLLGFLLFFSIVFGLFLPLRGTLLGLLFLVIIVRLLGSRRNVILSYMADLPGSIEFFFIHIIKLVETIEVLCALEGLLDILDDLGSDATPMTPRAVVGTLDLQRIQDATDERRIQRGFALEIDQRPIGNTCQRPRVGDDQKSHTRTEVGPWRE